MASRLRQPTLTTLVLDAARSDPLRQQVYDRIRDLIVSGNARPGTRLPSTRSLATELGLSRNTVLVAFDRLTAEGYIEGRHGAGSYVARVVPEDLILARRTLGGRLPVMDPRNATQATTRAPGAGPVAPAAVVARDTRPFQLTATPTELFPCRVWERLLTAVWRDESARLLSTDQPVGLPELRDAVASYLAAARGVRCSASQVFIVSGAQQALDVAVRALVRPGDAAWVEDPGYLGARATLAAAGARLIPVPVDAAGMNVAEGAITEPNPRVIYVTPASQFPLCCALSPARRDELTQVARECGAYIIEDDYDAAFRYAGRPPVALQAGETGQTLYVGSFSRVMGPAVRLGYLVAPEDLVERVRSICELAGAQPAAFEQLVLARFMNEGYFAAHLRRLRAAHAERRAALCVSAARELAGFARVTSEDAGTRVVADLEPWVIRQASGPRAHAANPDVVIAALASRQGLDVVPLSSFYLAEPRRQGLLLGFAGQSPGPLRRAVRELGAVLRRWHAGFERLSALA